MVGTAGLEADLRRHLELHQRQLAGYEEIERRDFPPDRDAPQDRLRHLVLRAGIDLETFWTQWLTHALKEFAELPGEARGSGPGPEPEPDAEPEPDPDLEPDPEANPEPHPANGASG